MFCNVIVVAKKRKLDYPNNLWKYGSYEFLIIVSQIIKQNIYQIVNHILQRKCIYQINYILIALANICFQCC